MTIERVLVSNGVMKGNTNMKLKAKQALCEDLTKVQQSLDRTVWECETRSHSTLVLARDPRTGDIWGVLPIDCEARNVD